MWDLISVVITAVLGALLLYIWVLAFPSKERPPGPIAWPFVGNNVDFLLNGFEKVCTKYNKRYGDIVECWLNGEKILIISDPALIKYITLKNGENYLRRFTSKEVLDASMRGGVGLVFNNNVDKWKFHRRIFKKAVTSMIPFSGDIILKNVHNLIHEWDKLSAEGKVIDVNEYTHKLSLDLIGELAFGLELKTVTDNFNDISEKIYHGVNAWMESFIFFFLYPSYWKFLPSPTCDKFRTDLENLATVERQLFREQKLKGGNQDSFLKRLSEIVDDETGQKFNEEEVLQDIREMLAGGSDTSANTLTYTLYFLSQTPHALEKLSQEIQEKFDESNPNSVKEMKYVEHVLNEAMRKIPAGPLIFRKAINDDKLGNYFIPKDTNVILNIWHTMTSEKYWNNSDDFIPERFEYPAAIIDHSFVPFGEGLRGCPGKPLAMYEMKVILCMLLKYYTFEYVGEQLKPWWGLVEHCGAVKMIAKKR